MIFHLFPVVRLRKIHWSLLGCRIFRLSARGLNIVTPRSVRLEWRFQDRPFRRALRFVCILKNSTTSVNTDQTLRCCQLWVSPVCKPSIWTTKLYRRENLYISGISWCSAMTLMCAVPDRIVYCTSRGQNWKRGKKVVVTLDRRSAMIYQSTTLQNYSFWKFKDIVWRKV